MKMVGVCGGCLLLLFLLVVTISLADGFEWTSDTSLQLTVCVGSKVTLPWQFHAESREQIDTIYWQKECEATPTTLASLYNGYFKPKPSDSYQVQQAPGLNAGLVLDNVTLNNSGHYYVSVTVVKKEEDIRREFRAFAYLTVVLQVPEVPAVMGDVVEVQEVTSNAEACAPKRQITLRCGNFTTRGSPPVTMVWTDPAGQVFPSTRFADGFFDLDLPHRPLLGNYSCHLPCDSPLLTCPPPSSSVLGNHPVHVTPPSDQGCEGQGQGLEEVTGELNVAERLEDLLQNMTEIQTSLQSLVTKRSDLKQEAESRNEQNYKELLSVVQKLVAKVDVMDNKLSRLAETTQCNLTGPDLSPFEDRIKTVEHTLATRVQGDQPVPDTDPLVSRLTPTFSVTSPVKSKEQSLLQDVVITPQGAVVMTDLYNNYVIITENHKGSDVTKRPLKYGTHARQLANMEDGLVAATVDDAFIYILDTTTTKRWLQRERWVHTREKYHGLAARSEQTLFASVTARDAGEGNARVDVISIHDVSAVVVTSLLNQTTAPKLRNPERLAVNDNHLYVIDTDVILRLDLDTHELTVMTGPRSRPALTFSQPRGLAFDAQHNMYLATGGDLCGVKVSHQAASTGSCLIVVSREGSWRTLDTRGKAIHPYGVTLTPNGLAVTWGSWVRGPVRSMLQFYDLVPPRG